MTIQELYYKFKLLYNKNGESKEADIPIENFVILYNKEADSWLEDFIRTNRHNSEILKINELIRHNQTLEIESKTRERILYKFPEDYFDIIPGTSLSYLDSSCKKVLYNRVYKNEDINSVLSNKYLRPSSAWERGVCILANDALVVYLSDFNISSTSISYYKKVSKIEASGYIKFDNTPSRDIDPENSDFIVHSILDRVVTEVHREFENQLAFQLSKDREI